MIPMFDYQYGDIKLDNIINHDKDYDESNLPHITFTEFINKIKNHEPIDAGTFIYITAHDLIKEDDSRYVWSSYTHIPTNTKIEVEGEVESLWVRVYVTIEGRIWIGDDFDDKFWEIMRPRGTVNAFEFKAFQEYT